MVVKEVLQLLYTLSLNITIEESVQVISKAVQSVLRLFLWMRFRLVSFIIENTSLYFHRRFKTRSKSLTGKHSRISDGLRNANSGEVGIVNDDYFRLRLDGTEELFHNGKIGTLSIYILKDIEPKDGKEGK